MDAGRQVETRGRPKSQRRQGEKRKDDLTKKMKQELRASAPQRLSFDFDPFWSKPAFLEKFKSEVLMKRHLMPSEKVDHGTKFTVFKAWVTWAVTHLSAGFHHEPEVIENKRVTKFFFFSQTHVIKVDVRALMAYTTARQKNTLRHSTALLMQKIEQTRAVIAHSEELSALCVPYWWVVPNIVCVMEKCATNFANADPDPRALLPFTARALVALNKHNIYPLDWKIANLCWHNDALKMIDPDMLVRPNQLVLIPYADSFVPRSSIATYPYAYMCHQARGSFSDNELTGKKGLDKQPMDFVCAKLYLSVTWSALVSLFLVMCEHTYAPSSSASRSTVDRRMRHYENQYCTRIGGEKNDWNYWEDLRSTLQEIYDDHKVFENGQTFETLIAELDQRVHKTFAPFGHREVARHVGDLTNVNVVHQWTRAMVDATDAFWSQLNV